MKRFEHTIRDSAAIHASSARKIVKIARQFPGTDIIIACGGKTVPADGLLRLMTLGVQGGDRITVTCDGSDEMSAAVAMQNYFWNHL